MAACRLALTAARPHGRPPTGPLESVAPGGDGRLSLHERPSRPHEASRRRVIPSGVTGAGRGELGTSPVGRGARAVLAANGELMTVDITSAVDAELTRTEIRRADVAPPPGAPAEDRGSLGTLSWPRAAKVAGLAAAVAALTALSIAA